MLADFNERLADASRLWTAHMGTAQAQMHEATGHLLAGFAAILAELDPLVIPPKHHGPSVSAVNIDARAEMLARCETRLLGLIQCLEGFVPSRYMVLGSVRSLSAASANLGDMAEDVGKLARQTHLLSINAAIEATRSGDSGRGFAVWPARCAACRVRPTSSSMSMRWPRCAWLHNRRCRPVSHPRPCAMQTLSDSTYRKLTTLMYDTVGLAFNDSKMPLVGSRLAPRIQRLGIGDFDDCLALIAGPDDGGEFKLAIDLLTINENYFFREPAHHALIKQELARSRPRAGGLGCRVLVW